jgi:hypothetical protein
MKYLLHDEGVMAVSLAAAQPSPPHHESFIAVSPGLPRSG